MVERVPQGKGSSSLSTRRTNPEIARDVVGTLDPKNPRTLIMETDPIDYKRTINAYVPAQYAPGAAAPFLVAHDGPVWTSRP